MARTQAIKFANIAHANAAVATINSAQGITGSTKWDVPRQYGEYYFIAKPDDGTDSAVVNSLGNVSLTAIGVYMVEDEDGLMVLDEDGNELVDYINEGA